VSETLAAPHENSYWVPLPAERIVAGEYPGDVDARRARVKISAILDAGITCLLDLTEHDELHPYQLPARFAICTMTCDSPPSPTTDSAPVHSRPFVSRAETRWMLRLSPLSAVPIVHPFFCSCAA